MKKIALVLLAVLAILMIAGCTTTRPFDLTNNTVGSKVGEATGKISFGGAFGANIDVGLQAAAKNGGITKIATVDLEVTRILGNLFVTYTTIVTGE
ncbi:MAG: TRL-like family protein [Treponema sp.]|jgi:uncharacterized protein YceK|nr:TRL-like family protein [Treponema sp.]